MPSSPFPYVGFDKDARAIRALWERFNAGLIEGTEGCPAYQRLLVDEWARCRALGVDVGLTRARRLDEAQLRQRLQAGRLLLEAAVPVLQDTGRFLDEVPGLMILTDRTGCVLHLTGDPRVLAQAASRSGIVVGSDWNEAAAGTNGMGTALATGRPVHVFASEHFCEGWHRWSCAAAPILDADGCTVLGAIDFTIPQSEFRDQALALSVSMATSIQARIALHRALERSRLMSAFGEASRHYPHDDLLAVDHEGRVVAHSPHPSARRAAERWATLGAQHPQVRETVDVTAPDAGSRIGSIVLLSSAPGEARARRAPVPETRLRDAVEPVKHFGQFLSRDADTRRMLDELRRVADADVSVLIIGETGTGKDLIARHLHECSSRRGEPFVAVNCAAISAELMESTLFGYVRGAFSGADPRGRAGFFEAAGGGTLFLDEIAELPLAMQAGLLRVLEDGSFQRVGACQTLYARCRIVAATHRDLERLVAQGRFRQDLYFRLKVVHKTLRPLRERRCDIALLTDQFLEVMRHKHRRPEAGFTAQARAALERHDWPGNARELRNVVETAVLHCDGPMGLESLPPELVDRPPGAAWPGGREPRAGHERERIVAALRRHRKVVHAARALGMARSTLYKRFEALGIDPSRFIVGDDE